MKHALPFLFLLLAGSSMGQEVDQLFATSQAHYKAGDLEQADEVLGRLLKADRSHYNALVLRGNVRNRQERFELALRDYNRAMKLNTEDPALYRSRGAAQMSLFRLKEALKDFDMAIQLEPENADGYFNRASVRFLQGQFHKAVADYNKALEINPDDAQSFYFRGATHCELKDFDKGLTDLKKATRLEPDNRESALHLAVMKYEAGQLREAIEDLSKLIASGGDDLSEVYYYRGEAKNGMKNKAGACNDFEKAAELGDEDAKVILNSFCSKNKEKDVSKGHRAPKAYF